MAIINLDISGPSYSLPESQVTANQSSINMYPVTSAPTNSLQASNPLYAGRGNATMLPTAGFELLTTTSPTAGGVTGCSGIYIAQQAITNQITTPGQIEILCYAVMAGRLIEFTLIDYGNAIAIKSNAVVDRGNLGFAVPQVAARFSSNGQLLFITWSGACMVYNLCTNVLSFVTLPFSSPQYAVGSVAIDGYFFIAAGSGLGTVQDQFYSSDLNATTFNPTNTARMQSKSDGIVGLLANKGELWGLGYTSVEVWFDNGNNPGMPFSKRVGSDIGTGTASPYALINVHDNIFWVDSRGFVAMSSFNQFFRDQSSGYQITKVSDDSVDQWLNSLPNLQSLVASTYVDRGNLMYELTQPNISYFGDPTLNSPGRTFVLNVNNMMWHEKQYTDPNTGAVSESYTNYYAQYGNIVLCGSMKDNNIYILNQHLTSYQGTPGAFYKTLGTYADNNAPTYRYRTTKIFTNDFKQITVNSVEIKCLVGQSNGNYTIDMRYSIDSGYTWSNWDSRPLGNAGEYSTRVIWNLLGTASEWQLQFRVVAPIKWSIVEAAANVTPEMQ